jgi:hypothetical protein
LPDSGYVWGPTDGTTGMAIIGGMSISSSTGLVGISIALAAAAIRRGRGREGQGEFKAMILKGIVSLSSKIGLMRYRGTGKPRTYI